MSIPYDFDLLYDLKTIAQVHFEPETAADKDSFEDLIDGMDAADMDAVVADAKARRDERSRML